MPVYAYKCLTCGREVEKEHSINDDPHIEISHISGASSDTPELGLKCLGPMKRLIAGKTSFVLNGGGWTPKHNG